MYAYLIRIILQMMMKLNPIARSAIKMLGFRSYAGFCINKGMLDPSKHTTMNHVPHNVYIDLWDLGQYPEIITQSSIAPRTYVDKVIMTIVQAIKEKYNVQLKPEDIINKRWDRLLKKTIRTQDTPSDFYPFLYRRLSMSIFVKESRWTWLKEQKMRMDISEQFISSQAPQTIEEFLTAYSELIEQLVSVSHFGFSPAIQHPESAQNRQLLNEMSDDPVGVEELSEERPENQALLNRILKAMHST